MKKLGSSQESSKKASDGTSPASQYARNTLGVNTPTPRHRSLPGTQEGQPAQPAARASFSSKSRLDPSDPSTWTSRHTPSFSEHRRAASETVAREDVPTIRLHGDADKPLPAGGINLDGSGAGKPGAAPSVPQPQASPVASSAVTDSSATKQSETASPTSPALDLPSNEEDDSRRFSNQSRSFSSVTTDSDRIGRISQESDADNENAVQESSGSSSGSDSDSSSSDQEDAESPASERGRQRDSTRESTPPTSQDRETPVETPTSPVIRGMYTTGNALH